MLIIAVIGIIEILDCVTEVIHTKTGIFMSHELKNNTNCSNRLP